MYILYIYTHVLRVALIYFIYYMYIHIIHTYIYIYIYSIEREREAWNQLFVFAHFFFCIYLIYYSFSSAAKHPFEHSFEHPFEHPFVLCSFSPLPFVMYFFIIYIYMIYIYSHIYIKYTYKVLNNFLWCTHSPPALL